MVTFHNTRAFKQKNFHHEKNLIYRLNNNFFDMENRTTYWRWNIRFRFLAWVFTEIMVVFMWFLEFFANFKSKTGRIFKILKNAKILAFNFYF
jgi:hypothetical protein